MLSLFCSTLTLSRSRQTGMERRDRLSVAACQPITTPHQQPCHLSPPPTPHPPTYVPLTLNLFMSFFHYIPPFEQSAFITFNYPLCQSSPSYRAHTLDCLTHPTNRSILQHQFTLLQLVLNYRLSFFLYNNNNNNTHIFVCLSLSSTPEPIQPKLLVLCSN